MRHAAITQQRLLIFRELIWSFYQVKSLISIKTLKEIFDVSVFIKEDRATLPQRKAKFRWSQSNRPQKLIITEVNMTAPASSLKWIISLTVFLAILFLIAIASVQIAAVYDRDNAQTYQQLSAIFLATGSGAWNFVRPFLQLVLVLIIIDWLLGEMGNFLAVNIARTYLECANDYCTHHSWCICDCCYGRFNRSGRT